MALHARVFAFLLIVNYKVILALESAMIHEDGSMSTDDYLYYEGVPLPVMKEFTLCFSIAPTRLHAIMTIVSYAVKENDNEIRMDCTSRLFRLFVHQTIISIPVEIVPFKWHSVCFSMRLSDNKEDIMYTYAVDNVPSEIMSTKKKSSTHYIRGGGILILGQDQDYFGGGFQAGQSFAGEVAHLTLWDIFFQPEHLGKISKTLDNPQGAFLVFQRDKFKLHGNAYWVTKTEKFVEKQFTNILQPVGLSFPIKQHLNFCKMFKGTLGLPFSPSDITKILKTIESWSSECFSESISISIWLGMTDSVNENKWVTMDNEPINFTNWEPNEPNGGLYENCAGMITTGPKTRKWVDVPCDSLSLCAICLFKETPQVKIRGSCMNYNTIDHDFFLYPVSRYGYHLRGHFQSDVIIDEFGHYVLIAGNDTVAKLSSNSKVVPPIGRHKWEVFDGKCGPDLYTTLSFSVCQKNEFTCSSGECISLSGRCDQVIQCEDSSDEYLCSILEPPSSYKPNLPPPSLSTTRNGELVFDDFNLLPIIIYMNIESITSINVMDMEVTTEYIFSMEWFDPRLTFHNLAEDISRNYIPYADYYKLWLPEVSFPNARGISHSIVDKETKIYVVKEGNGTLNDNTQPFENLVYKGSENRLFVTRKYNSTFTCPLNLNNYPFDEQTCKVVINLQSTNAKSIYLKMKNEGLVYSGHRYLVEYEVSGVSMVEGNASTEVFCYSTTRCAEVSQAADENVYTILIGELYFKRSFEFHLVGTFLPTLLMIIIAYLTFFFKREDFNERIMVSLTSLLVLSSLFNQSSASLPKTSYFKLVDIWYLTCIVAIFIIIVIQTILEYLRGHDADMAMSTNGLVRSNATTVGLRKADFSKSRKNEKMSNFTNSFNKWVYQKDNGSINSWSFTVLSRNAEFHSCTPKNSSHHNDALHKRNLLFVILNKPLFILNKIKCTWFCCSTCSKVFLVIVFILFCALYWILAVR